MSQAYAVLADSGGAGLATGGEIEPPVVAAHAAPRWELELALLEQREAESCAEAVRGRVVDRRERVREAPPATCRGVVESLGGRRGRDPAALLRRQQGPPDLVDRLVPPVSLPVADPADRGVVEEDPELRISLRAREVAGVARGDRVARLRAAEVLHHRGVAQQPLEQRQVVIAPRLDPDGALAHPATASPACVRGRRISHDSQIPTANSGMPIA